MKRIAAFLPLTLLVGPLPLAAATVLQMEHRNLRGSRPLVERSRLVVEGDRVRVDRFSGAERDPSASFIYRGDRQALYLVDHAGKTVTRLDRTQMDDLQRQLGELTRQLHEQLRQLPPEQRARAEELLQGSGLDAAGQGTAPGTTIARTAEEGEVGGFPCRRYEVRENGEPVGEYWVTDWRNLRIGEEGVAALRTLGAFAHSLSKSLGEAVPLLRALEADDAVTSDAIEGFPVVHRRFEGSRTVAEDALLGIGEEPDEATEFEPPADYKPAAIRPGG